MTVDNNEFKGEIKKLTLTTQDISKKVSKLTEANDADNLEEKVHIENLKANYQKELQQYKTECDLHTQKYKAECDLHLQKYKAECEIQSNEYTEMFRAVLSTGQTAIRSLIIINGGAAVALLAFIGNIWVKNQPPIKGLSIPLLCFVLGVLGGGVISALTYLGQHDYSMGKKMRGDAIRYIIIIIGICSYVLFAYGTYKAYQVFSNNYSNNKIDIIKKNEEGKKQTYEGKTTLQSMATSNSKMQELNRKIVGNADILYLINIIIPLATTIILLLSAIFALRHLKSLKLSRDVSLMAEFYKEVQSETFHNTRTYIYEKVPHPKVHNVEHEQWLEKIRSVNEKGQYKDIEKTLYQFDRIGLFIRTAGINSEMAFALWYDVVARLTVLLQKFISKHVAERGDGCLINFAWLAQRNLEYIEKEMPKQTIFLKTPEEKLEISPTDIREAIRNFEIKLTTNSYKS